MRFCPTRVAQARSARLLYGHRLLAGALGVRVGLVVLWGCALLDSDGRYDSVVTACNFDRQPCCSVSHNGFGYGATAPSLKSRQRALTLTERTLHPTNIQPAFEPGSMLVLTARVRWRFDFQTRNVDDGASSLCGISML